MNKKGFTLIELLIVVAIIGILAAVGAVVIPNVIGNSKNSVLKENHKKIVSSLRQDVIICELEGKLTRHTWPKGEPIVYNNCILPFDIGVIQKHFMESGLKNPYLKDPSKNPLDVKWNESQAWAGNGNMVGRSYVSYIKNNSVITITTYTKDGIKIYDEIKYR